MATNNYTVTTHDLGNFNAGSVVPTVAFLLITPESGFIIRASDFNISGGQPVSMVPPTFAGGALPSHVSFVKFEDTDNMVYLNYTNPTPIASDANSNYDPNWSATASNTVVVIVALSGFFMPSNDLDIKIDIDSTMGSVSPIINTTTLI
tara:strand:- start:698 stop:1144 length:447 start_codon:yes stop_codon:yes gene_type:complete